MRQLFSTGFTDSQYYCGFWWQGWDTSFHNAYSRRSSFYCVVSSVFTVGGLFPHKVKTVHSQLLSSTPAQLDICCWFIQRLKQIILLGKRARSPGGHSVWAFIMNKSFCTWWPRWIIPIWAGMTCSPFKQTTEPETNISKPITSTH